MSISINVNREDEGNASQTIERRPHTSQFNSRGGYRNAKGVSSTLN
jgi:hypothetical protein